MDCRSREIDSPRCAWAGLHQQRGDVLAVIEAHEEALFPDADSCSRSALARRGVAAVCARV